MIIHVFGIISNYLLNRYLSKHQRLHSIFKILIIIIITFESLASTGTLIFIGMKLESKLAISFLQIRICRFFSDAKNLVIIATLLDLLHSIQLIFRVFLSGLVVGGAPLPTFSFFCRRLFLVRFIVGCR